MVQYLDVPANGDYADTPDAAGLDILGDMDIRLDFALTDWTPSTNYMFGRYISSSGDRMWRCGIDSAGQVRMVIGDTGGAGVKTTEQSSVAVPFNDGTRGQIRIVTDIDDEAGNTDVLFYTRTPFLDLTVDTGWVQLGTTQTDVGEHTWVTEAVGHAVSATDNHAA